MTRTRRMLVTLAALFLVQPPARAHFTMLLPGQPSGQHDQPVVVTYQWGHPFEHQLFDAPTPQELFVLHPDGTKTDLLPQLKNITLAAAEGKKVNAFRFDFTPQVRGDFRFILWTPPIWMEEDGEF